MPAIRCLIVVALATSFGCAEPDPVYEWVDREEGDRTPLSRDCDEMDDARCVLPWPSNAFTIADPSTETGLRLEVSQATLYPQDVAVSLSRANGFSRVSPILAVFERPVAVSALADAMKVYLVEPGHEARLTSVPLEFDTVTLEDGQTAVVADPRRALEPAADYLVVVTDTLTADDGSAFSPTRGVSVALQLQPPESEAEAALVGYHAPARAQLAELDIAPQRVLRVWDFTTRSAEDARRPLRVMREAAIAAVTEGSVTAVVDLVEMPEDHPEIAVIVRGRVTNLPTFLDPEERGFFWDESGDPIENGRIDAPFRILIPAGTGDYRFVMYGHGTGGNERDDAFDSELGELGIAKVGVRLYGWTDEDVLLTFAHLQSVFDGSFEAAAYLVEALAHAAAIEEAMSGGVLADLLSADMLGDVVNPAAGRRPDASVPMWVGGSLGGTTGLIYAAADPDIRYAVLNVPGAAWAQWVWHSYTFDIIHPILNIRYDDDIDLSIALSIGQTNLDLADGAVWVEDLAEHPTSFLIQESMGDPVMPNVATEMVATIAGAQHIGGVLEPIDGIEPATQVVEGSAITQFRAPPGDEFAIHGFAARNTPAGDAAREQILEFIGSAFEGESRIVAPSSCPDGCDYGSL